jgi:hypothetical protein
VDGERDSDKIETYNLRYHNNPCNHENNDKKTASRGEDNPPTNVLTHPSGCLTQTMKIHRRQPHVHFTPLFDLILYTLSNPCARSFCIRKKIRGVHYASSIHHAPTTRNPTKALRTPDVGKDKKTVGSEGLEDTGRAHKLRHDNK